VKPNFSFNAKALLPALPALRATADDRRLTFASACVCFFVAFALAQALSVSLAPGLFADASDRARQRAEREQRFYPVLVEQEYRPEARTDQVRAFSDVTAEGTGGITALAGFHTLSSDDTLETPRPAAQASASNPAQTRPQPQSRPATGPGDAMERSTTVTTSAAAASGASNGANLRIPANYRFQQDFLMRFDGSSLLSIPRQELAGFRYFQNMLRQIRENFSPPGINYIYYDRAGYVLNEPIKPQVVSVQFMLDREGNVIDVRKVQSIGQDRVDESCLNSIRGQNFGPVPPEVWSQGNIFGLNFVFPAIRR
jgi:TonB C terminal